MPKRIRRGEEETDNGIHWKRLCPWFFLLLFDFYFSFLIKVSSTPYAKTMAIERYDNWIAPWGRSKEDHYRNETNMTPLGIHFIIIDCFVYYFWSFRSFCLVGSFVSFRSFRSGRFVGFACFVSFCSRFRLMFLNLVIARGNYQNQWKMPYISANRHM